MHKQNLTQAHQQLFRRSPDERYSCLEELIAHCQQQKRLSSDRWHLPQDVSPCLTDDLCGIRAGSDGAFLLNDWSFSQLCKLAHVGKETVNRVSSETAGRIFQDTLPTGQKPLQLLILEKHVRSIHGAAYTRLWNAELLQVVREFATDFQPPQKAAGGGTGLYAGEQDMFCFLIDPTGWVEIEGEAFAPGFFVWNSEVGKRSVGISTFWFQAVCANHIVWDAVDVVDFSRKHTANVHEALSGIRSAIEQLVAKRDERRDAFVSVIAKAMRAKLGDDADEALKMLNKRGINQNLGKKAVEMAQQHGALTIFAVVDALTRLASQLEFAGTRLDVDLKTASLLELAVAA